MRRRERGYRRRKKKRGGGVGRKERYRTKNEVKRDQEDPEEEKKEDTQEGREENIKDIVRGRNVMQQVRVDWQKSEGGEAGRAVLRSDGDAWSGAKGEIAKMKMIEKMKR